jgi:membrane-associated progesterone receptor component
MSDATEQPKKEKFAPKQPVTLKPPKDDVIDRDYLAKCDGMSVCWLFKLFGADIRAGTDDGYPTLVAIKVFATSTTRERVDHCDVN